MSSNFSSLDIATITKGARLKTQRAYRHIDEMVRRSDPLDPDLYTVEIQESAPAIYGYPNTRWLVYRPKKPVPKEMALIMGDAIHNLRSALDHVATAVYRKATGQSGDIHFPFHETRQNLITSASLNAIKRAIPNSDVEGFFCNEVQSYRDGNGGDLWSMNKLDNIDKHNFIIPNVTVASIKGNVTIGPSTYRDIVVGNDAGKPFGLIKSSVDPISVHGDLEATVDISFPKGGFFGDEPVIPTLTNLAKRVDETIEAFATFLLSATP